MDEWELSDELNYAYLAGIIDGEGWIGLNRKGVEKYDLCVAFKSTCAALPSQVKQTTGLGYIRTINDKRTDLKAGRHRQELLEWRVFREDALIILLHISQRLVVKKQQARLGIEYQRLTAEGQRARGEWFHTELKRLNGRETFLRANQSGVTPPGTTSAAVIHPPPGSTCG